MNNNLLKTIYSSYYFNESKLFQTPHCPSQSIENSLKQVFGNAPSSADTFVEIANILVKQQQAIESISAKLNDNDKNIENILNYIKSESANDSKINGKTDITSTDDVSVYGIYKNDTPKQTKITGKTVAVKNVDGENSRLDIKADDKVTIDSLTLSGNYPKALSNAQISINNNDGKSVEIKNSTINQTSYNAIEIGLADGSIPSEVVVDGVDFKSDLSNNAILVFGLKDNGTITIKNCHFKSVSNCVRFSNKSNATGVTINIENCTVDKWDSNPKYAGFLIFEDYTSKDAQETQSNNLFGDGKITVNLDNVICNGQKITKENLKLGAQTADTFAYVYDDKVGYVTYTDNKNSYPNFNCK